MRKTKIICTIGPSSENEETLTQMCLAGMNVARLNFSHGSHEEHEKKIELIKKVRRKLGLPIAIMLDTKGPEYRIRTFASGKVTIADGSDFTFTTDEIVGDETKVAVNYKALHQELKPGDTVTVNNGMVKFQVQSIQGHDILCKCLVGGVLSDRKSMSFPNKVMSGPYLSEQDKSDILFGIKHGVDFIAASFVSTKQDVLDIQALLDDNGGSDIEIIAKIENQSGVDNVTEICSACGGIMIARGDLGVEIPYVEVPAVQKKLTRMCRMLGKRVITATEMLESMIQNPRPTRAEISDVANAVYDGTSCVMLSGESAAGKYPVEAVKAMAEIAEYTEQHTDYKCRFRTTEFVGESNLDGLLHGHRCERQGHCGLLRQRQNRYAGQPVPYSCGHHRHDHRPEDLAAAVHELGRDPGDGGSVPQYGGHVLLRQEGSHPGAEPSARRQSGAHRRPGER